MFGGVWILASSSGHFALSELADEAWNQARGFVRELTRDVISHPKPPRTTGSEAEGILRLGKLLSKKSSVAKEGGRGLITFFPPEKRGLSEKGVLKEDLRYFLFFYRYSTLPFTKNPEKYIKYTVEEIEAMLKSFFDVSA